MSCCAQLSQPARPEPGRTCAAQDRDPDWARVPSGPATPDHGHRPTVVRRARGAAPCLEFFVGDSGTAKTTVATQYLQTRDPDSTSLLTINMSSKTSSNKIRLDPQVPA